MTFNPYGQKPDNNFRIEVTINDRDIQMVADAVEKKLEERFAELLKKLDELDEKVGQKKISVDTPAPMTVNAEPSEKKFKVGDIVRLAKEMPSWFPPIGSVGIVTWASIKGRYADVDFIVDGTKDTHPLCNHEVEFLPKESTIAKAYSLWGDCIVETIYADFPYQKDCKVEIHDGRHEFLMYGQRGVSKTEYWMNRKVRFVAFLPYKDFKSKSEDYWKMSAPKKKTPKPTPRSHYLVGKKVRINDDMGPFSGYYATILEVDENLDNPYLLRADGWSGKGRYNRHEFEVVPEKRPGYFFVGGHYPQGEVVSLAPAGTQFKMYSSLFNDCWTSDGNGRKTITDGDYIQPFNLDATVVITHLPKA